MFAAVFMIQIACLTLHTTALPEATIRIVKIYIPILVWYFVEGQIELKMLEAFFLVIIWVEKKSKNPGGCSKKWKMTPKAQFMENTSYLWGQNIPIQDLCLIMFSNHLQ